jgi:hypothetical protein
MEILKAVTCNAKIVHGSEGIKAVQTTPWIQPSFISKKDIQFSIHVHQWLLVFIDEAHVGRDHHRAIGLWLSSSPPSWAI